MTHTTRGVWYMLLAALLFTLMTVFVKLLEDIPALEIIFVRALVSVALCLWGLQRARVTVWGEHRLLLSVRGLAGTLSLTLNFYLVQHVPLATATTMTYLAPIATTLLGVFIVGERVKPWQWGFFILSFAGVVMVQGFDARISWLHLGMGLMTSLLMGLAYNIVRKLSNREPPLVIIFYFPLMCLPVAGLWSAFNWVAPSLQEWGLLLLVGLSTQMAQYFMTRSYQLAEISTVSIVNYTGIIYAILIGVIIFDEHFNALTYLGMGFVLAGVVMNVFFKQWLNHRVGRKAAGKES